MGVVALLLAFVSCTNDISEVHSNELKQIVMTASDFETENGSRTNFQITNAGAEFSWAANDTVGIFPNTGAQAYFPMTSGAGTKSAKFDGGGWALKNASTYGSYYPFIADFYLNKHAIPVDYTGQAQTGDASTAHLGAYDFMAAAAASPKNGNVTFAFKHLGALIQLKLTLPQATTLKSVTLTAADDVFSVKGKVDIMASTLCIEPVTSANELTLTLKDVATTEANQVVTLYMMVPPANLSEQTLKAVVTTADKGTMEMALESKNFQAGKAYGLSGSPESGEIVGDGSYKDGVVSLEEAGTMKKLLGKDYLSITSLKVVGPINGDDVYYLRKMLGAEYFDQSERGKLTTLDLSDARIVKGGGWYYEYKYNSYSTQHYTTNDVIGERMFDQCTNLKEIAIPNGVSSIGEQAFTGCDALSSVYIKDLSAWCRITFSDLASNPLVHGAKLYLDNKEVTELVIPEDITEIKNYAFYGCKSIIKVVIPDHVTSIGNSAFYSCNALSSVVIGNGLKWIDSNTFAYCESLSTVVIGNGVVRIGDYAFYYCRALTSVTIGENVTELNNHAFYHCDAIKEFYCNAVMPPAINTGYEATFASAAYGATLYVPIRCSSKYSSSDWGKYFKSIKEFD